MSGFLGTKRLKSEKPVGLVSRLVAGYCALWMFFGPSALLALPQNPQVTHGQIDLSTQAGRMQIQQLSQMGVINWEDFSIGAGEWVDIQQLNVDAALLNRVTGANPSELLGQLNANGRVYVVNPNGVLVGPGARINTAEFIASTLDIADADFLNGGSLQFEGESDAGIVNLGEITASNGDIILVAHVVENAGELEAAEGAVVLGAGQKILLQPDADQRLVIETSLSDTVAGTGVDNSGLIEAAQAEIQAAGGSVYDLAINQSGTIRATGVTQKDGRVLLTADGGDLQLSGQLSAQNADGSGGEILLGGEYQGSDPAVANAANVFVTETAQIDVSAQGDADAGRAIVWSGVQTDFHGNIDGQGGASGGDGAFVEVSGKQVLNYYGQADLRAASGVTGHLLLDPGQAIISTATDDTANGVFNNAVLEGNLSTANVTVNASNYGDLGSGALGEIIVNAPVTWSAATTLTLKAGNYIEINADLSGANGQIELLPGTAVTFGPAGTPSIYLDSAARLTAQSLLIAQNLDAFPVGAGNPPPLDSRSMGDLQFDGIVDVDTLDLSTQGEGIQGQVTFDHPSNAIGTLTTSETSGRFFGDFSLIDGDGGLVVDGDFSNFGFGSQIAIVTEGDLTLAAGTQIAGGDNSNIVLASQSGSFLNLAGATAVGDSLNGRYLIYSDDPANTTKGGLTGLPVYDRSYAVDAPGSITQSGSRFLYRLAPTLTFTANDLSRTENTANPTLSYTLSGLVGGDTAGQAFSGTPLLSTLAQTSSAPGSYEISIAPGSINLSDFNYAIDFETGTLTVVDDLILFVTADDFSRYYGDTNPAFTASYSGFSGEDDASIFDDFTVTFSTVADLQSPVGTYDIVPSGAATLNDYSVTYRNGTLTIDPRLLTIRANDFEIDFLDDEPIYTASFENLASFDDSSALTGLVFTDDHAGPTSNIGDYTIAPSGVVDANYAITYESGTLTVHPRAITASVNDSSREYGESNVPQLVQFSNLNGYNRSVVTGVGNPATYSTDATESSDVGNYDLMPDSIDNDNFSITYEPGTLSVTPAALTIEAEDASRIYGDANPSFSVTSDGLKLTDTLADAVSGLTIETSAELGSNVGSYAIVPSGTSNGNYTIDFRNGLLSISQAVINYVTSNYVSRTYGDANPSFSLNANGLKNGDTAAEQINFAILSAPDEQSDVGNYTVSFAANSLNYAFAPGAIQPGLMEITPRALTITADSFTREYGDANPSLTAQFDGLAWFDDSSVISGLSIETPATQSSSVLEYGINLFGGLNPNYTITKVPGTLTVTPAPVTFSTDSFSIMYGEHADSQVVANYTGGLKLMDSLADLDVQVDAGGATDVGTYPLNLSLGNANYYVGSVAGTITIEPRPVHFEILDRSRVYGEILDPGHTVILTGGYPLVDPLESVFQVTDPTTVQSDVGTYLVGGELINSNYQLLGVDAGLLQITPRLLALKPESAGMVFGDDFGGVDYLVAGLDGLASFHTIDDVVVDTLYTLYTKGRHHGFTYAYELVPEAERTQFLGDLIEHVDGYAESILPGGYTTQAVLSDEAIRNYYIINAPGTFGVVPRPVTVAVEDLMGIRNHGLDAFTASVLNLAQGDQGQSIDDLFPELGFELIPVGVPERVESEVLLSEVPAAPSLTDQAFLDTYTYDSSGGDTPTPPDTSTGGSVDVDVPDGSYVAVEIDIQIEGPEDDSSEIVEITGGETVTVSNREVFVSDTLHFFSDKEVDETPAYLKDQLFSIRPAYMWNDKYVVTDVDMGLLTIKPDPEVVSAMEQQELIESLREQFYNPSAQSGDLTIQYAPPLGFTRESLPAIFEILKWSPDGFGEIDYEFFRREAQKMVGEVNLPLDQYVEIYYSDLRTNLKKQELLMLMMERYSKALMTGEAEARTDAAKVFKTKLESYVDATKQALALKMESKMYAWENRNSVETKELAWRNEILKTNRATTSMVVDEIARLQTVYSEAVMDVNDGTGLDKTVNTLSNFFASGEIDDAELKASFYQIKEDMDTGTTVSLSSALSVLKGTLAALELENKFVQSNVSIAARKLVLDAGGQGDRMANTLFAGDVPYESIMEDSIAEVLEDKVNLFVDKRIGAGGALVGAGAGAGAGAAAAATTVALLGKIFVNYSGTAALTSVYGAAAAGAGGGIGFGIAVGVSRAIMIGEMAADETVYNNMVNNAKNRSLALEKEYDLLGYQTNQTEMMVDDLVFKMGFMGMASGAYIHEMEN
ncbi:MBG domain-containing protein [Coraliomargarita sp. SDUM461003]|uniref:MBG domain-containing protein n=1 Tax=Thalassobacterium maritimum TaxID=3041265 RepID=A0ABU1ASG3_9BACT|nr:MBG domain-containing protein [Coraliomargarita sp. SDUM461003]MDQ8207094.1 MBG domain-containing protein [Coraliomargarita sp. SDUM461003]